MSAWSGITKATTAMAYDNGCIHRERTEQSLVLDLVSWLRDVEPEYGITPEVLTAFDAWLSGLSEADLQTVVAGEEGEQKAVLARAGALAPEFDLLLTWIFEEVL